MRDVIGIIGRATFWIGLIVIVGHFAIAAFKAGKILIMILGILLFPFTYLIHPWANGLWWVFVIANIGYFISVAVGKMKPIE